jgi:hypothetical protein
MQHDDDAALPPLRSLRDKLQARGAKPHRRMSDLSRYMLAHYDELHALITVDRYGWADLASLLAEEEGLTDELGRPVTADIAKLAWSRLTRRNRRPVPARPVAQRQSPTCDPPDAPSIPPPGAEKNELPLADQDPPAIEIRPVRLLGGTKPLPPPAKDLNESTPSLLSDEEVERRIADLAERQGGQKIAPAKVID